MALAKSNDNIDAWAVVSAADIRKGGTIDLSAMYQVVLAVSVARIETADHANGALITVEVRFGSNDDDWHPLTSFRSTTGTVATIDVDAQSASGQTQLKVQLTANFETKHDRYFLKDNTIANSEIVRNNGFVSNDYIVCLDNLVRTHEDTADVYTEPDEFSIALPDAVVTARVIVWNDDADCDIATRTDLAKMTGI